MYIYIIYVMLYTNKNINGKYMIHYIYKNVYGSKYLKVISYQSYGYYL